MILAFTVVTALGVILCPDVTILIPAYGWKLGSMDIQNDNVLPSSFAPYSCASGLCLGLELELLQCHNTMKFLQISI